MRTALAASLLTGRPFAIDRIRAGRDRPGLLHQHLAAVRAAGEISAADITGAALGSPAIVFRPGPVTAGRYHFSIGTAGSTSLVLQTILLPLLEAGTSVVTIEGGTHNEGAPPFEFLDRAFAPVLGRMGAELELTLERPGFYPKGGGLVRLRTGQTQWRRLTLDDRGPLRRTEARALVSRLPLSIAQRELAVVAQELGWAAETLHAEAVQAAGPGNIIMLVVASANVTEVFSGFGRRGLPAEEVAQRAVEQARGYLEAGVPVGQQLADQLLLPLARAGGESFVTSEPTTHFRTNAAVVARFFDIDVGLTSLETGRIRVECRPA